MAEGALPRERRKVLRARLRILTLLVAEAAVLSVASQFLSMDVSAWVVCFLALLFSTLGWITFGTRRGGWLQASILTWLAHLVCATALFMWQGVGLAAMLTGAMYGTIWTLVLLAPIAGASILVRDPSPGER